jgi:hypothetical protein
MVMKKASDGDSPLRQGAGRASGPSRSHVDDGSGLQYVSWKIDRGLRVFPSRGIYRRNGSVRRWTRGPDQALAWPGGGPRHGVVWPPSGSPPSLLWTPSRFRKNRNFGFCFVQFRKYFLCSFSETQKQQKTGNWHYGISLIG